MRATLWALLACTALAGGCVTAAEQRVLDEQRCRSYGFRQNSDAFANCLLQVDLDRSAAARVRFERNFGPWYGPGYYYW